MVCILGSMESLQIACVLFLIQALVLVAILAAWLFFKLRNLEDQAELTLKRSEENVASAKAMALKIQEVNNSLVAQVAEHHNKINDIKMALDMTRKPR